VKIVHTILREDFGVLDANVIRKEILSMTGVHNVTLESARNGLAIEYDPAVLTPPRLLELMCHCGVCPAPQGSSADLPARKEVSPFAATLAKTHRWLDDLGTSLGWSDRERCYHALKAVLHALRDRLLVGEAADLGAQLPMLVRGFYYEGWRPSGRSFKYRDKNHFLERVRKEAPWLGDDDIERVVTAVFALLVSEIGGGEPGQVRHQLPPEIRELWAVPRM
jgi:uncharacterized protein (DUF2267 family)